MHSYSMTSNRTRVTEDDWMNDTYQWGHKTERRGREGEIRIGLLWLEIVSKALTKRERTYLRGRQVDQQCWGVCRALEVDHRMKNKLDTGDGMCREHLLRSAWSSEGHNMVINTWNTINTYWMNRKRGSTRREDTHLHFIMIGGPWRGKEERGGGGRVQVATVWPQTKGLRQIC